MLTDVQHINLGLSKISSSRINRIDPAVTPLESFMAANYPHWRRRELSKRRWVFALEENYRLTLEAVLEDVDQPYKFRIPNDCLKPVRGKTTEWKQRGRYIYSNYETLAIDYIRNVPEADFDPLFTEVLACAVAAESVEFVTQSNAKKEMAFSLYKEAVVDAAKANAFVLGPEDMNGEDETYSWIMGRDG